MTRTAIKFGLFAVFTVGLTLYLGAQIAKVSFGDSYTLTAEFSDVTGLSKGDDIKLAGVKVGQVSSIEVDDQKAVVRMSVDEDVKVPVDSEAAVRWRNLLGQRVLYLYPGEADEMLDDDAEVVRTRSVVDIGALINELGGVVTAVEPAQLNELMQAVEASLDGNEDRIGALLDSAGSLLETLSARDETIGNLLEDFDTVSGALADRDQQIRSMIENLALLTETFADNENLLDSTLVQLAEYSGNLDGLLTDNEAQLKSIVSNLAIVTDTVTDKIDTVEAQLANFPSALQALHEVTNRGEFIVIEALCFSTGPPPCPTPVGAEPTSGEQVRTGPDAISFLGPQAR